MSIQKEIVDALREINWKGQFVGVTYRSKKTKELARYTLRIGESYKSILEKSLLELQTMKTPENPLELEAFQAVKKSLEKSLAAMAEGKQSEDYTKRGMYQKIEGTPLQVSIEDGTFELSGMVVKKVVLEPGEYKEVNSKPLTIAKNRIEKMLPKSKYRTFALDKEAFESARICGEEITS